MNAKRFTVCAVILCAILLAACTVQADVEGMSVTPPAMEQDATATAAASREATAAQPTLARTPATRASHTPTAVLSSTPTVAPSRPGTGTPLPQRATNTRTPQPTVAAISATPAASPSPASPQGRIPFEFLYTSEGHFVLPAGRKIFLVWEDFPPAAARYEFVLLNARDSRPDEVLGVDDTPESGVTVEWLVPEDFSGTLVGHAYFADGGLIRSEDGGAVTSGKAPPDGVCSIQTSSAEPVPVFESPQEDIPPDSSLQIGQIAPGVHVRVLGRSGEAWLQVDLQSAYWGPNEMPPAAIGWVWRGSGILYHGPCDPELLPDVMP